MIRKKDKKILAKVVVIWFNKCMENISNQGEKMRKEEIQKQIAKERSELWSIVHEVSKLDMKLARKLDIVISDLQDSVFKHGMEVGEEITKKSSSTIMEDINAIKNLLGDR